MQTLRNVLADFGSAIVIVIIAGILSFVMLWITAQLNTIADEISPSPGNNIEVLD